MFLCWLDLRIFDRILRHVEEISVEKRSKHAAISLLISHIPIIAIISHSPGLVRALLGAALASPSSNYVRNYCHLFLVF